MSGMMIDAGMGFLRNHLRWEVNSLQKYPYFFSLLAAGTGQRLLTAAILVAGLWLAVAWALH